MAAEAVDFPVEPVAGDDTAVVTLTLLADVVDVLKDHGIGWADDDPRRKADAFVALVKLADAVAGEHGAKDQQ